MEEDFPVDMVEGDQAPVDPAQPEAENYSRFSQQQLRDGVIMLGPDPTADSAEQAEIRRQFRDRVTEFVTHRTGVVSVIKEVFGYRWLPDDVFNRLKDEVFNVVNSEPGLRRAGKNNVAPERQPSGEYRHVPDRGSEYRRSQRPRRNDPELNDMLEEMDFGSGGRTNTGPGFWHHKRGKRGRRGR